jgi:hypothetical protein
LLQSNDNADPPGENRDCRRSASLQIISRRNSAPGYFFGSDFLGEKDETPATGLGFSCFGFFFSRLLLCWPLAMMISFSRADNPDSDHLDMFCSLGNCLVRRMSRLNGAVADAATRAGDELVIFAPH